MALRLENRANVFVITDRFRKTLGIFCVEQGGQEITSRKEVFHCAMSGRAEHVPDALESNFLTLEEQSRVHGQKGPVPSGGFWQLIRWLILGENLHHEGPVITGFVPVVPMVNVGVLTIDLGAEPLTIQGIVEAGIGVSKGPVMGPTKPVLIIKRQGSEVARTTPTALELSLIHI